MVYLLHMKSLQLEKPHAIVTFGIQGSGKTFFAEKFSDTFNAPFIEQSMFSKLARDDKAADTLMKSVLDETVKTGRSIVIELALSSRNERLELANSLRKAGYVPLFVWVQVDTETALNRTARAAGISPETYRENLKRFSPAHPSERALVISGKHTFATQAKAVLKKLSAPRQVQPPVERKQPPRGQIIVR